MFWNRTITLYNKHEDELTGVIKWYRHTLSDCFYKGTNNTVNVGGVQLQTDDTVVRILEKPNYLPPYKWLQLPNDEKNKAFTLKSGDLIFLGDITEEIDEYSKGKRSTDIIQKYSAIGSMFIKSVNTNDFMPGAHYLVRGE